MPQIEYLQQHTVYDNPNPHVHSRHGYFPGMARLAWGELICMHTIAEAFEAPNATTWISRSGTSISPTSGTFRTAISGSR